MAGALASGDEKSKAATRSEVWVRRQGGMWARTAGAGWCLAVSQRSGMGGGFGQRVGWGVWGSVGWLGPTEEEELGDVVGVLGEDVAAAGPGGDDVEGDAEAWVEWLVAGAAGTGGLGMCSPGPV